MYDTYIYIYICLFRVIPELMWEAQRQRQQFHLWTKLQVITHSRKYEIWKWAQHFGIVLVRVSDPHFFLADPDPGKNEGVSGGGGGGKGKKCFLDFFSRFSRFLTRKANSLNRRNEIVCIAHLLLYKIMIYSFISLPFCPDPDPDPQIYADPDPDPGRAKTCGSVRIRIRIRNPGFWTSGWSR